MSAQNYKIIVAFDDSQMAKLEKQFSGTFGAQKSGGASGLGGNTTLFKNLTKLGLIATASIGTLKGIEKLVSLSVNSSPILATMLKLLNTGIMFILRPIGDFLGFFLRPLMVLFLRTAIKLYQEWGPVLRKLGAALGAGTVGIVAGGMKNFESNISGTLSLLTGDWEKAAQITKESSERIGKKWGELVTSFEGIDFKLPSIEQLKFGFEVMIKKLINFAFSLPEKIRNSLGLLVDSFTKLFPRVSAAVSSGLGSLISFFGGLETNLSTLYTGVILPGVNAIGEFFNTMTTSITDIITIAWDAITQFFQEIVDFFTTIPQQIMGSIFPQAAEQPVTSGQANPVGISVNFYDTIIEGAESISDFGNEIASRIQDAVAGRSS